MVKRIISLVLAGAATACLAAGCSGGEKTPTPIENSYHTMELVDAQGNRMTNFVGMHTMIYPMDDMTMHMNFADNLVGKGGFVKERFEPVTPDTQGPASEWVAFMLECYERELIPIIKIGGENRQNEGNRPQADADGSFRGLGEAVKRVLSQLPLKAGVPVYVEIFNEPNLRYEWGDTPNPEEYARCLVDLAAAIRSLGEPRFRVMNGALSPGGSNNLRFVDNMFKLVPESLWAFDVWAVHPYPKNHPPEYNIHDGTAKDKEHTIDSYMLELDIIQRYGRDDVKVIFTETGYELYDQTYKDYPEINEDNRADYMLRAFRDYWSKWPEIIAVVPFEMWAYQNKNWTKFDWIELDTQMDENGFPTKPMKQYTAVAGWEKPPYVREPQLADTKDAQFKDYHKKGNLAYGAKVETSTDVDNYGWKKDKLVNGFTTDSDLGWSSGGAQEAEWIEIDLGSDQKLSKVYLYARSDTKNQGLYFPQSFRVQIKQNDEWINVYKYEHGEDTPLKPEELFKCSFKRKTARYVRVVIDAKTNSEGGNSYHAQLSEVEIYQ